jgi:hypothetical protein
MGHWRLGIVGGTVSAFVLALAGCGPTANPTATTSAQPTSTTQAAATATTAAAPTATGGAQATTTPGATATAAEVRLRPVPVLPLPAQNPLVQKGGVFRTLTNQDPVNFGVWDSANGNTLLGSVPTMDSLLDRNEFELGKNEQILPSVAYD